ncbi:MAG: hypothetical protein IK135_00860, partial [Bacteroidales bacterium]|nr:hypothetical protein [Bacteroidales bacterium]
TPLQGHHPASLKAAYTAPRPPERLPPPTELRYLRICACKSTTNFFSDKKKKKKVVFFYFLNSFVVVIQVFIKLSLI